jgi:hypothetical protein
MINIIKYCFYIQENKWATAVTLLNRMSETDSKVRSLALCTLSLRKFTMYSKIKVSSKLDHKN